MTTGAFYEPYPIDRCPRCGDNLFAPDDNLDRACRRCRITVKAALVTWEIIDRYVPNGDPDVPTP